MSAPKKDDDEPVWEATWVEGKKGGLSSTDKKIIIGVVVGVVGIVGIVLAGVYGKKAADKAKASSTKKIVQNPKSLQFQKTSKK
jgi:hypothetical protein